MQVRIALFLVSGFVFVIILQAWFVRNLSQLKSKHEGKLGAHKKFRSEFVALTEEVQKFKTGIKSSESSIEKVSQEITQLTEEIAHLTALQAEHGEEGATDSSTTHGSKDCG